MDPFGYLRAQVQDETSFINRVEDQVLGFQEHSDRLLKHAPDRANTRALLDLAVSVSSFYRGLEDQIALAGEESSLSVYLEDSLERLEVLQLRINSMFD